ncbi:MAG TPA: calcium-binding protein [Pseudomonas sp.]
MAKKQVNNKSSQLLDWLAANGGYNPVELTEDGVPLVGTSEDDLLTGGAGDDVIDGGEGDFDTVNYGNAKKVKVDLAAETATGEGNDTLVNVENVIGSAKGSDFITGDELGNMLDGWGGNDKLWGDAGDDILFGGDGNDQLRGGDGYDELDGGAGNDQLFGDAGDDLLYGGAGNDQLRGGEGNDVLYGDAGNDTLRGEAGDDTFYAGAGNDSMFGGAGNDTYYVEDAKDKVKENAGEGTDEIVASYSYSLEKVKNVENLTLSEDAKPLNINATGNSLDNVLTGNSGDNVLKGLAGNDILVGREGDDTLIGGDGDDIFVFDNLDGVDSVEDFTIGSDLLQLDALVFTSLAAGVQDANLVMGTEAADSDDFLVFDADNGALYYDADASGAEAAVQIATVGVSSLVAADFVVV